MLQFCGSDLLGNVQPIGHCQNKSEQGENLKRGGDGMHSTRTSTALFMNAHSIAVYIRF